MGRTVRCGASGRSQCVEAARGRNASRGSPGARPPRRGLALRQGDWKYIQGGTGKRTKGKAPKLSAGKLYHLKTDIDEQNDVSVEHKEIADQMRELLQKLVANEAGVRAAME